MKRRQVLKSVEVEKDDQLDGLKTPITKEVFQRASLKTEASKRQAKFLPSPQTQKGKKKNPSGSQEEAILHS